MKYYCIISSLLSLLLAVPPIHAQIIPDTSFVHTPDDSNTVIINAVDYAIIISAPDGWAIDLKNASHDNYTAVMFPDSQSYFDHNEAIYTWVFSLDSLSFKEFVSADSLSYLLETDSLEFIDSYSFADSTIDPIIPHIVLETADPGGIYETAMVAYLDLGRDIAIYHLNISDRMYFISASEKLREVVLNTVHDYLK